ncbi:cytosolic protein [Neobacillus sp. MM2021_6]|uniref:cytosolic protein n=1 Tax=Bacillaceae TaxID=186817 RepID=UPI0014074777|nr:MULTISPECIES: cytosolic protein [Bacillaceae]MBO0958924.1 cytosolic protein [Neobacillus sp. MM2021_6]NHC17653.1 cytosolic protein [Bacillus sp. MM2020_4]
MGNKDSENYTELSNVEKQHNYLTAQEFPEGPFGSPIRKDEPVKNKSTPWVEGQRRYSAYNWEFKSLHQDKPRQMEGSHPPHDDPDTDIQEPYSEA